MPTAVKAPELPKKWSSSSIPSEHEAKQSIKILQARAKLAGDSQARKLADLTLQKLGNFLLFEAKKGDQNKQAKKIGDEAVAETKKITKSKDVKLVK
ncbi:hypothetical protein [Pseudovibrio ascidiaceicola]|uniref:hypothetical protein n=1 Tax=Pseudovibrio ascidiaceicola TaxID=285279 RepID=UPI000D689AD6|nr:hypothetical protein [Pseudovibrio ascidiaceicola]